MLSNAVCRVERAGENRVAWENATSWAAVAVKWAVLACMVAGVMGGYPGGAVMGMRQRPSGFLGPEVMSVLLQWMFTWSLVKVAVHP